MKNKRGFEFGFAWIFAIFIGAIVIFLAVYASTSIIGIKRYEEEAATGAKIGSLLNPISTNLEQAKLTTIYVQDETIIFNECESDSMFGEQLLSTSVRTSIGQPWSKYPGPKSTFRDRYLFSNKTIHGKKEFYVLSLPFEFPFKISDVIVMWSDTTKYCFINPTSDFKREIERLKLTNVEIKGNINDCSLESKKVYFGGHAPSNYDIAINNEEVIYKLDSGDISVKYVHSSDNNNKFPLLYAAIFSDPETYECQVKRLMGRAKALVTLYEEKFDYLKGSCLPGATSLALENYKRRASNYDDSNDLLNIATLAQEIEDYNDPLKCRLF